MNKYINELYFTKDKNLHKIFDIHNKNIVDYIINTDINLITESFQIIFYNHKILCLNFTYESAINVLKLVEKVELTNKSIKQIVKNVIFTRKLILEKDKIEFNDKEFKKQLFSLFVLYLNKGNCIATYICNILCMLHFEKNNYKFINDLVKSNNIQKKNTDYYIFMYYKGLINIYNESLGFGYKCFMESMKLKKIRKYITFQFYLLSLLTFSNKLVKNKFLFESKNNNYEYNEKVMNIKEHIHEEYLKDFLISGNSIFINNLNDDFLIFNNFKNKNINDFSISVNFMFINSFIKLKETVMNGFLNILPKVLDFKLYKKIHLFKIMEIYLPLITIRNLIFRFYKARNCFSKLLIDDIIYYCKICSNELFRLIFICIDKGIIRGYLSLNKNVLVLSKENPFPDFLNYKK